MRRSIFLSASIMVLLFASPAYPGAVVAQRERAQQEMEQQMAAQYKQQIQQQYQQAVAQKAAAEYQAAQIQAAQVQAVQMRAAQMKAIRDQILAQAVQAQIQARVAQYVQRKQIQEVQQALLQKAVEEELYKRMVAQVQQGMAAKIQQELIEQAVVGAAAQLAQIGYIKAAQEQVAAAQLVAAARQQQPPQDDVRDIVDIGQVWAKLEVNSKAWLLLMDPPAKATTVNEFIERFRKEGIKIAKPPGYYAQMIDDMAGQNPQMLLNPFKQVLQMLAIMEYDFDNGTDRDALARKLLGPSYAENRKRLGK